MFRLYKSIALILASCLFLSTLSDAGEQSKPALEGPEGERAYKELADYYADNKKEPDVKKAVDDLSSDDEALRKSAGRYLLALCMQAYSDERNGRKEWISKIASQGNYKNDARHFREWKLDYFWKHATGEEAIETALWLVEKDYLPKSNMIGADVLCRVKFPGSQEIFKKLLGKPHLYNYVATSIIKEIGKRKMKELSPTVLRLCNYYSKPIREAARAVAAELGIKEIPDFKPEEAFTEWLDKEIRNVYAMVMPQIPANASWVHIKITGTDRYGGNYSFVKRGWVLDTCGNETTILDWFGQERKLQIANATITKRPLAEEAEFLASLRAEYVESKGNNRYGNLDILEVLCRRGGMSDKLKADQLTNPEGLIAAWCYAKGDKKSAARVIFPLMSHMENEMLFKMLMRELLGHVYHQEMLIWFSYKRDYKTTIEFAKHLSKPVFKGYTYHYRAKKLAKQLSERMDDFKAFCLPTPEEWKKKKKELSRSEQVKFLAKRLRLLNCFQGRQPGGIVLSEWQFKEPRGGGIWGPYRTRQNSTLLTNPYEELLKLQLKSADIIILLDYISDDNYAPTFSFWRDFHYGRSLWSVSDFVSRIIYKVEGEGFIDMKKYASLDEEDRKKYISEKKEECRKKVPKDKDN